MALLIRLIMALFTRPEIGLFHPTLTPFLIHTVQPVVKSHGHPVIIQVNDVNKDIYDCFPVLRAVHIANLEVEKEEFNVVVGKRRTHG